MFLLLLFISMFNFTNCLNKVLALPDLFFIGKEKESLNGLFYLLKFILSICIYIKYKASLEYMVLSLLFTYLLIASLTDLKAGIVPDRLSFSFFLLIFMFRFLAFFFKIPMKLSFKAYIDGLVYTFIFLYLIYCITSVTIGGGDIKAISIIGLSVGLKKAYLSLMLSLLLALIVFALSYVARGRKIQLSQLKFLPLVTLGAFFSLLL